MGRATDFDDFARDQHPRLVGALTLYCGDALLAEELAQDALVRIRERWSRMGDVDNRGAYLHRTAINLANSTFRRRAAERRAKKRLQAQHVDVSHLDPCGADGVAVREAVAQLPERQREAVVLRYLLDRSVAETASLMEISEGSVKSNTHRGLARMRELLEIDLDLSDDPSDRDAVEVTR